MHKHNVIFNKILTKLVTTLTKCFFYYLNPTSYLNPFMYNVVKWPNILYNFAHFTTLYMNGLNPNKLIIAHIILTQSKVSLT